MSSNIYIQRICERCGREFTARTTVTRFCGDHCAKRAYKERKREASITASDVKTQTIKEMPLQVLKAKDILTVKEAATLLTCSVRTVYHYIESGELRAINLGQRLTRIKRAEIDRLFECR